MTTPNTTAATADEGTAATVSPLPLMELSTGFWAFKTLAAAHELDLFTQLSGTSGTTPQELAEEAGINVRPAEMLLTGCTSLGLLEKQAGRYRNSALSETYLVRGKPYYFGGWVRMLDQRLYPGWGRLSEAIRTNRPTTWDPDTQGSLFETEDPEMLGVFFEAMHSLSSITAGTLAGAVDFNRVARLIDLGGGSGAYDIELCRIYPHLRATVFDLQSVVGVAEQKAEEAGVQDRVTTAAGDFFDPATLPAGHDAALLSMVLHDWNEAHCRQILQNAFQALEPGGTIIINELLVNDEKTGPPPAALMSLNMLVETEGRNYTPAEYSQWLSEAGFQNPRTVWFEAPGTNGVVVAEKP